jgi:hypothetical protein
LGGIGAINNQFIVLHSLLSFDVKLGVDDVAHDGGKVEVFDCFLGTPSAGEEHTGQAQVFTSTRVKKDLHFFHLTILSAHILQEGFPHIVIQSCESHFLQWDLSNIELIQLELRDWEGKVSVFRPDMATGVLEVFDWYVL